MPNYVTVASHTTEIWPFAFREISTFVLSPPTISFELHAKVAEEIDLEMCSYGQLSEVQMLRDLYLDLGWGQGHINVHSYTSRTNSLPNHVTVASRTSEIWPFEFRKISTLGEV